MIAVVGASGFIGCNIQDTLICNEELDSKDFIMVYFNNKNIKSGLNGISFDEFIHDRELCSKIDTAVFVSGNSMRSNDILTFYEYINKDISYLQQLKNNLSCNIIVLSSASVYDGIVGEVNEDSIIMPNSLYGISKLNSELIFKYLAENVFDKKLVIYRLVYAFGNNEKKTRLIPQIAQCFIKNRVVKIKGYNAYIDPLSAKFVSILLLNSAKHINVFPKFEIINLAGSKRMKLLDLVKFLREHTNFKFELVLEEDKLSYYVSTTKLGKYLKLLNLEMEDIFESLSEYYQSLLKSLDT